MRNVVYLIFFATGLISCGPVPINQSGNVGCLIDIKPEVKSVILKSYIDSLLKVDTTIAVPEKWRYLDRFGYDHLDDTVIYFRDTPEEMYMVTFDGQPCIRFVYNEQLKQDDWIASSDTISTIEKERIQKRFKSKFLDLLSNH